MLARCSCSTPKRRRWTPRLEQRLEAAKINQRRIAKDDANNLRVPADAIQVACQASCPTQAIMFGDLAHKDSTVVKWKASPRNYDVLKYIGTRPRTSYLARIRNVNPLMPDDRGQLARLLPVHRLKIGVAEARRRDPHPDLPWTRYRVR